MTFDQAEYDVRCEWGAAGVRHLAVISDVVIVIDVLSFCTAVDIAVSNGAVVLPYPWGEEGAREFAEAHGAVLASRRSAPGAYSLSPGSLQSIPRGCSVVLPSPNGGTLSLSTGNAVTFAACLRNCEEVAARARTHGNTMAVIPAGETWEGGALRPSLEDLVGAGAVLAHLPGRLSPEAELAVAAFERFRPALYDAISRSSSGKELIDGGFAEDVELACQYGVSSSAPVLVDGRYLDLWKR